MSYRSYILKVDGQPLSNSFVSVSGVPQGSHCGPILFIITCRDVVAEVTANGVRILIYADDTKMYRVINSIQDVKLLQESIDHLSKWSADNKLLLNASKTYHVSFTRKRVKHFSSSYYIGNNRIATVDSVRDLGVTFDSGLTFAEHIHGIHKKSSGHLWHGF